LTLEAQLMVSLLERWGLIAAVQVGEDSAGRAKSEVMPASEVVDRAEVMAILAVQKMRRNGWLRDAPPEAETGGEDD
jgi:hypothetical protein